MPATRHGLRHRARARALLACLLVASGTSCFRHAIETPAATAWSYEVDAPPSDSRVIAVEATFEGSQTERLAMPRESASLVGEVTAENGGAFRSVARRGDQWIEPSCKRYCKIRYRIDLGALAEACRDEVSCARRVGDATLSPSLAWLMHPVPRLDVPVRVRVHAARAGQFASGMRAVDADGSTFAFRSFDLDEGSFSAFGPLRTSRVDVSYTTSAFRRGWIDIVFVGESRYAMSDEEVVEWVSDAAGVVAPLFGRFPVEHATLFVLPAEGAREVVFGRVLALAGASVVIVIGDDMRFASRRDDAILVHELLHLGFPTFRGEGRWLSEGIATYYESVLRMRADWVTEAETFRRLALNLPRGVAGSARANGVMPLDERKDDDSVYWGGALFCFAADVKIREATHGRRSLDDVARAVRARGGDAMHVWSVRDVMRVGDEVTGTNVLSDLYERHALGGDAIDLDGLLTSLGIARGRSGEGALNEDSPLAWVRRGIAKPSAPVLVGASIDRGGSEALDRRRIGVVCAVLPTPRRRPTPILRSRV